MDYSLISGQDMVVVSSLSERLVSLVLLETDCSGEIMVSWEYPGVAEQLQEVLLAHGKTRSEEESEAPEIGRLGEYWFYMQNLPSSISANIRSAQLVLVATQYQPPLFLKLLQVLADGFKASSGDCAQLVATYLKAFSTGKTGDFRESNFPAAQRDVDARKLLGWPRFKDAVTLFSEEDVQLVWLSVLMRLKVAVISDSKHEASQFVMGLPLWVPHRKNAEDWIYPSVSLLEVEVQELRSRLSGFVAAFDDVAARDISPSPFEVIIDLSERTVSVLSPDVSLVLVPSKLTAPILGCSDEESYEACFGRVASMVGGALKAYVTTKKSGNTMLSEKALRGASLPPTAEDLLRRLASAEGLVSQ